MMTLEMKVMRLEMARLVLLDFGLNEAIDHDFPLNQHRGNI